MKTSNKLLLALLLFLLTGLVALNFVAHSFTNKETLKQAVTISNNDSIINTLPDSIDNE